MSNASTTTTTHRQHQHESSSSSSTSRKSTKTDRQHHHQPKLPPTPADVVVDPLIPYFNNNPPSHLTNVRSALLNEGYCVLPSILTHAECDKALDSLWDFVEDLSNCQVCRSDPDSWYPLGSVVRKEIYNNDDENDDKDEDEEDQDDEEDPWPHTGYSSFPDMFQSYGAGFVLGHVRELIAERIFEPLFDTRELHCSKEGFTFHRPTIILPSGSKKDEGGRQQRLWIRRKKREIRVCGQIQRQSHGEHYDQGSDLVGLHTIQSSISFITQEEPNDGCFLCIPHSHSIVHQNITSNIYRGKFPWVPLTDDEIQKVATMYKLQPKKVWVKKGDVILWRSDLIHAGVPPLGRTTNFRAVGYVSMQPASLTPSKVLKLKMDAYKMSRTGDHRSQCESWHEHRRKDVTNKIVVDCGGNTNNRSLGLIPNGLKNTDEEQRQREMDRAVLRGVRFVSKGTMCSPSKPPRSQPKPCDAYLETLTLSTNNKNDNDSTSKKTGGGADGNLLVGQDKYLGGMCSPCGTFIYGVPGHAKRVLRVNTQTNDMDYIGPEYSGKFKWLRGVEIPSDVMDDINNYPRGCCLALPSNYGGVLKINPETNFVSTFGSESLPQGGGGGWLYHGGNLSLRNGCVYAIPANASQVMKINPRDDSVEFIGPTYDDSMKQKWFGGIMGADNCIYGIPHNATGVLKINPMTDDVSVIGDDDGGSLPKGQWKWHGGLSTLDRRKIYGFPNNANSVLVIDTIKQIVYTVSDETILQSGRHRIPQDGRYKYLGGALTLNGKYAYLFPCDAERVLRIDTETDHVTLVGPELLEGENKYQNGFVGRDGCLYGIPQRASGVLRITPPGLVVNKRQGNNSDEKEEEEEHVDVLYCGEDMVGIKDKFEGGVLGMDGCIYCIPLRAKALLKVNPGPTI